MVSQASNGAADASSTLAPASTVADTLSALGATMMTTSVAQPLFPTFNVALSQNMAPEESGSVESAAHHCFQPATSFEPLDMRGTALTYEKDALACQRRCALTVDCVHFTFWVVGGHCHIEDIFAVRHVERIGFVSGPFQCWEDFGNHSKFTNIGLATFLPSEFGCVEMGTTYSPTIRGRAISFPKYKTSLQVIVECQNFCMSVDGCAHFVISTPARRCTLAGVGAKRSTQIMHALAGPPTCASRHRIGQDSDGHATNKGDSNQTGAWASDNSSMAFLREFLYSPGNLRAQSSGIFGCATVAFLLIAGVLTVNRKSSCRTPYFAAPNLRYAELPMFEGTATDEARFDVDDVGATLPFVRV